VNINGIDTCYIEKKLKYTKIKPVSWINFKTNTHTSNKINMNPIYSLDYNNKIIYITAYTRLAILYNSGPIKLNKNIDINGIEYYKTDTPCVYIKESIFIIVFEWIFDLLHILKKEYNFHYEQVYNTLFCDLLIETIRKFDISKNFIQGAAMCAVHNIVKFDNIDISLDKFNFYTLYTYNIKDLEKYDEYQKKYIDNNLTKSLFN